MVDWQKTCKELAISFGLYTGAQLVGSAGGAFVAVARGEADAGLGAAVTGTAFSAMTWLDWGGKLAGKRVSYPATMRIAFNVAGYLIGSGSACYAASRLDAPWSGYGEALGFVALSLLTATPILAPAGYCLHAREKRRGEAERTRLEAGADYGSSSDVIEMEEKERV